MNKTQINPQAIPNMAVFKLDGYLYSAVIAPDGTVHDELFEFDTNCVDVKDSNILFINHDDETDTTIEIVRLELGSTEKPVLAKRAFELGALKRIIETIFNELNTPTVQAND